MSKERARRRAVREHEAAVLAEARAAAAARRARRTARGRALRSRLPARAPRPSGVLALRRRRRVRGIVVSLLLVNILLWALVGDPALQALAVIVSLLAAPVLHTVLFRRP